MIYPSQFANRLQINENENENEEDDWSSSESSDGPTAEELLSYMMLNPMSVSTMNDQIPLENYVLAECPVSNKHVPSMIQILIIKCTT